MGSGWSNDIPNPFPVGGGGQSGEIDILNSNNQVFIKMNAQGFIMTDPTTGQLLASITPANETVPPFGEIFQGLFTYDPTVSLVASGLTEGQLAFFLTNQTNFTAYGSVGAGNPTAVNVSPTIFMESPSTNSSPDQAFVEVVGLSQDGTGPARIILGKTVAGDCPVMVWGTMSYAQPGTTLPESWHVPALNANWATTPGYPPLQYKRTPDGRVTFAGSCQWNSVASGPPVTIFTLPAGYRPNAPKELITRVMPAATSTPNVEGIQVLTDGTVQITNYAAGTGPGTPITFDDLSFYLTVALS